MSLIWNYLYPQNDLTMKNISNFLHRFQHNPAFRACILILISLFVLQGCELLNKDEVSPNIRILSPGEGAEFEEGDVVSIELEAEDDMALENVSILINDQAVKSFNGPPLIYNWNATDVAGTQKITAMAEDGSGNVSTEAIEVYLRRIVSFDESSVLATADDRGKVKIKSNMDVGIKTYDLVLDLTIADELGNPIPGAEVIYSQVNGKCLIYFYDPVGDHTSGLIIGTPEELKEQFDGSKMKSTNYAGPGSDLEFEEESAVIVLFIAAVLTVAAIAYAEVSAIISMYEIQTFYLTDFVREGEDYIMYCKTFEEIADLINSRTQLVLNLTSIVISYLNFGVGGTPTSYTVEIAKDLGWPGVELLREAMVANAIEKWGIARNELEGGRKFGVKLFPYEEDATLSNVRNMFAVYQILEESPECSVDGNVLQGTITDAASGDPVENALIQVYNGGVIVNNDYSDQNGHYSFMGTEGGNYTIKVSKSGYIEGSKNLYHDGVASVVNFVLSERIGTDELRIVLSWDQYPSDLDLHLFTASGDHIYWKTKGSEDNYPFIYLDIDDVKSYGPETITMKQIQSSKIVVFNYSGQNGGDIDIKQSSAKVDVYRGSSKVAEYNVPSVGSGPIWEVCNISSSGVISPINIVKPNDTDDNFRKK